MPSPDPFVPVTLTPLAAGEIRVLMAEKAPGAEYGLRVGLRGGGCGGASFLLGFDKRRETDNAYSIHGIPVLVDRKHVMYLLGMEIDFEDGENGRGFTFNHPRELMS
ncbi:MAG: iron-sulfur cluster assembly accessory protein [Ferruginibacter sp.]|nr:iron-sulfur cluster assembly accessory protein [Cytophagales bacterium]